MISGYDNAHSDCSEETCELCALWVKNNIDYNLPAWQDRDYAPCIREWNELTPNIGDWADVLFYYGEHLCHRGEYWKLANN